MTPTTYFCPACNEEVRIDPTVSHNLDLVQCLSCGYRSVLDYPAGVLRRDPGEDDIDPFSPSMNQD